MTKTSIEWADTVWNPITGCSKVSAGCANCYAERFARRLAGRCGYPAEDPFRVTLHPDRLDLPFRWQKPRRVFVNSMGDLFHPDVPGRFINEIWMAMRNAIQHTYLILTKRPEQMLAWTQAAARAKGWPIDEIWPDNVWLGVTAENQQAADERIPILLQTPAAMRFVSVEPMLGPVDLGEWLKEVRYCERHGQLCDEGVRWENDQLVCKYCRRPVDMMRLLDWVIVGGETGPNARPCHPDWVRSLRDQCQGAGVPFFFKQWGDWAPRWGSGTHLVYKEDGRVIIANHEHPDAWKHQSAEPVAHVGKRAAGRLLDGRTWEESPMGGGPLV